MKKSNIISLLLVISGLLTMNLHCEKDDPQVDFTNSQNQLPPITTSGANTFGCTLNGKNWVAYTDYSFPKLSVEYDKSNGTLRVIAYKKQKGKDDDETLDFNVGPIRSIGFFTFSNYQNGGDLLYSPPYAFGYTFVTDSIHTGTLEILKIDTVGRIVSGKFMADLTYYDANVSDSIIQIRNGRFDVKY
jgi:hypothetical protein